MFFAGEEPESLSGNSRFTRSQALGVRGVFCRQGPDHLDLFCTAWSRERLPGSCYEISKAALCRSSRMANCSPTQTSPLRTFGSLVLPSTVRIQRHWRDIVPQSDRRIQQFTVAGDRIFVTRVDRFSTQIEAFGIKDGERKDVPFSPHGTIDLLNPTNRTDSLFYSYTSIAQPPAVYCYDTREEKSYAVAGGKCPIRSFRHRCRGN